ncbi:ABC transporter permease [Pusillimonas caeni]|uniref:ABC transporter permease n=1 Tax=Pusillimonas caeni TaxID=1348472 RepID=UPI000E59CB52|nr:ABC transporter permease [Pusillimonas caeni]TFL15637.1 ABC transporter permease [Pusillimonas caeni]
MTRYLNSLGWKTASVLVWCALLLLWQLIADAGLVPRIFLPGPDATWAALMRGLESGRMTGMLLATTERMLLGWLLASLAGIALGAVIGMSGTLRAYLEPTLEALRPLPSSAIIPVAIALFGLGDGMVYTVICFGALWPMLLSTIHGFSSVERTLYEFAHSIGMSRMQIIMRIALPSSMPEILAGMRVSLTITLILTIVVEMLAGQPGLGTWILLAGRAYRAPDVFAGILLLGALGYASSLLFSITDRFLLRWRRQTA